jgi:hypothetical protein
MFFSFSARARIGILSSRSRREAAKDISGGVPAESGNRRTTEAAVRIAEGQRSGRQSECVGGNMPDVQDGMTADGGPAGGGKQEAAGGRFGAREAAIRSNPPPSVRASSPDARRPPPGGRRKRRHAASVPSTSGAAQRRTLPSPASSRARSLGAEGLAGRLASSATGMTSPERLGRAEMLAQCVPRVREQASHCAGIAARGNHRRTRDDGSGGPVTGRSGGTTDHAAERNAGRGRRGAERDRGIYREPRQRRA